jgi:hypothetical protein
VFLAWPRRAATPGQVRSGRMLAMFFIVSYVLWVMQYGILRYTTPLEVAAAAMLVTMLSRLPGRFYPIASTLIVVTLLFATIRPELGRRPFSRHFVEADWPALPSNAMVVTTADSPLGYFMLGLPDRIAAVAIRNNIMDPRRCTTLQARVEARIRDHRGPIWLLEEDQDRRDITEGRSLARDYYGLQVSGTCTHIRSTFGRVRLCPLQRSPEPMPTHCPLPQA